MPRIYIPTRGNREYKGVEKWGEPTFLTHGNIPMYTPNALHSLLLNKMADSKPSDYLVPCGPASVRMMAAALLASKHGVLNLLLWQEKSREYMERTVHFH